MEVKDLPLPAPVELACEKCHSPLKVRTHGLARFVVCGGCQSAHTYDPITSQLEFKRTCRGSQQRPYLEVGDRGELDGRPYLVTGWIAKKEAAATYYWIEYHLFNPVHGFAQLSCYEGHWTFHEQLRVYPRETNLNDTLIFDRRVYEPFNRYGCTVLAAGGEFTHDINDQQRPRITELVSPPYMLTRELDNAELAWYLGRYMEPEDVKQAFGRTTPVPARKGVGACQQQRLAIDKRPLITISIAAFVLLLLTQSVLSMFSGEEKVLTSTFTVPMDSTGVQRPIITPSFDVDGFRSNVEVAFGVPGVDNSWCALDGALVNDATGAERGLTSSVEYYHGYEGGEYWKEGGTRDDILLSGVPAGRYHLEVDVTSDPARRVAAVDIQVRKHLVMWSNFFVLLLVALAFPLFIWWRVSRFEAERWDNN